MSNITIYHNPRCSKSRNTLALLEERGISPTIRLYLKEPLDAKTIKQLLSKLGMKASELVRRGEADFNALNLSDDDSEQTWIDAMVSYPKLIERPIVESGERAIIGRPPENVLDLLD